MNISEYTDDYRQQVIDLILHIQNNEAKINLSINEQPDLLNVKKYYFNNKGKFWIAIEEDVVIGTIGLMNKGNGNGVLKKFFVSKNYRNRKIGLALYEKLYEYVIENNFKYLLLDTPSVALSSHKFYERAGFHKIDKIQIPFEYDYPDRDSYLYLLSL